MLRISKNSNNLVGINSGYVKLGVLDCSKRCILCHSKEPDVNGWFGVLCFDLAFLRNVKYLDINGS